MNKKDTNISITNAADKIEKPGNSIYSDIICGIIVAILTFFLGMEIVSQICVAKYGPPQTSFDKKMMKNPDGTEIKH